MGDVAAEPRRRYQFVRYETLHREASHMCPDCHVGCDCREAEEACRRCALCRTINRRLALSALSKCED